MPVSSNFQVVGLRKAEEMRISEAISRAVGSRAGRWRVQFLGSKDDEMWEMCVSGPGVETSEYLDGELGQHEPEFIAAAVQRIVES